MRQADRWTSSIFRSFGRLQNHGDERRTRQKLIGDEHLLRDAGVYRSDILGGWTLFRMEGHQRHGFWNL